MPDLTDTDRSVIARARELAALPDVKAIRAHAGKADSAEAAVHTLGQAQYLLGKLADLAERLGGGDA